MANIKSAKKRIGINAKKTLRNKMIKSRTKTEVKKLYTACKTEGKSGVKAHLISAQTAIDKACSKGVFHKNTASRKKSRLAKMVNKLS